MKKKSENESSSQISIEYPRDFKIIHNKKTTFLVNPLVLSSVSDLFHEKYIKEKITSLEVDDRINDESFSIFFSLAHGQKVNLTLKNAFPILRLAKSWKSPIVQKLAEKYIAEKPEVEVKIAEIIDNYESLDLLPTANMFKGKHKLFENMFQNEYMHSVPLKPLNALLEVAMDSKIDRKNINSFLIDHFEQNTNLKSDFLNNLDYSLLNEENLRILMSDKRTKNNPKIKEASKHISLQKGIPKVELASVLIATSKKSKSLKKSKMIVLSQTNNEGPRVIKMKEPYIGIFAKISYESNCEPFKNEFIRVSTTSHDPQNFLNPSNNDDFIITTNDNRFLTNQSSSNEKPLPITYPYVIFQLPISVSITSYEIKNSFKPGFKEWTLYGSKNSKDWIMIDNQESPDEMIEPRKTVKIELEEKTDSFSSFKLSTSHYYIEDDAYELVISSIEFFGKKEFADGVFAKLKSEEKYINVITSSNNPQLLISPRHKKVWYSANEQNQSITFEFLKHKVQPTKYTLKSGAFWHPRSWQLSGSYDGKKWFILDKKTNAMQMDRKFVPNVWKIQQDYHICKFLKITQIGQTYDGMNILCLSGVEFFGNVESDESEGKRLKHNIEVFEELRSSRGFKSPRSPRTGTSAPTSPTTKKISPHITSNKNEQSSDSSSKQASNKKETEKTKTQKKEDTEKKKKEDKKEKEDKKKKEEDKKKKDDKKEKEEDKKKKEDKEKEKKKEDKEKEKKKEDKEKEKKKESKKKNEKNDSNDSDSGFGSSDFTASSGTIKSTDTKDKSSKKSETVSTTDVTITSETSDTDDNKKSSTSKDKSGTSNAVSTDIEIDDFTSSSSSSKSKDNKKDNKSDTVSDVDVISISDKSDTDDNKKDKEKDSNEVSVDIDTNDFASTSETIKSTDTKDKSSKKSETVSTTDVTITSETSDTDDNKKGKNKEKDSNEVSVDIDTNDFASTSETIKSTDTKDKSSKESETVSTTDVTITSEKSDTDDNKKGKNKEKDSNEVSVDIDTNDFASTSETIKSTDTKDKSSKESETVSTITSETSDKEDNKKSSTSKDKSETSNAVSTDIEIDDFTSSSSSKSKDNKKDKSEDNKKDNKSDTVSDVDVISISDKSDTDDNKKDKEKDSNDVVTDLELNDFTSNSDSSKSSDKSTKEKTNSDSSSSKSSDSDDKKEKDKSEDDKKDKKSKSSDSSDIEAIFSDTDSSKSSKSKKSDNDELNKNIEVKSDEEILVISDGSSDKNDDKKDSKSNDDVVEILDDFTSDDPDAF